MIPLAITSTDAHGRAARREALEAAAPARVRRRASRGVDPLLPARQVRHAPADRVRGRRSACCCSTASCAHYVDLRARGARGADEAAAAKPAATPKKTFWSGELVIARIFDETHDVKTFRFVAARRRPAAVRARRRPVPQPGARRSTASASTARYTIASSPTRSALLRDLGQARREATPRSTCTRPGAKAQRVKVSAPAGKFVFAGARVRAAHRADRRRHRHHADDVDRPQPDRPRLAR